MRPRGVDSNNSCAAHSSPLCEVDQRTELKFEPTGTAHKSVKESPDSRFWTAALMDHDSVEYTQRMVVTPTEPRSIEPAKATGNKPTTKTVLLHVNKPGTKIGRIAAESENKWKNLFQPFCVTNNGRAAPVRALAVWLNHKQAHFYQLVPTICEMWRLLFVCVFLLIVGRRASRRRFCCAAPPLPQLSKAPTMKCAFIATAKPSVTHHHMQFFTLQLPSTTIAAALAFCWLFHCLHLFHCLSLRLLLPLLYSPPHGNDVGDDKHASLQRLIHPVAKGKIKCVFPLIVAYEA